MTFFETLSIANFVLTGGVLVLVLVALLPHLKQGLLVVRDAVLWCALLLVVMFLGWVGWSHVGEGLGPEERGASEIQPLPPSPYASQAWGGDFRDPTLAP
jgi:hypothetical protein